MNGGEVLIGIDGVPSGLIGFIEQTSAAARTVSSPWQRAMTAGWLPWTVAGLVLAAVAWHWMRDARASASLSRTAKAAPRRLDAITEDIRGELEILARIGKHRPLYPEEEYFRSKMLQYRKMLQGMEGTDSARRPRTRRGLAGRA